MNLLDHLRSREFLDSLGYDVPADVMRVVIRGNDAFAQFQNQYRQGEITDAEIEGFVHSLMETFRRGQKFPFDRTLAFLVVALERITTPFVRTFISDLSRIRVAEIQLAPRVAQFAMLDRAEMPENARRVFLLEKVEPRSRIYVQRSNANKPKRETHRIAA